MARRRTIIAFQEVESSQDRAWRHAASGMTVDEIVGEGARPRPKLFHDGGHMWEGRVRYWCAADKPAVGDDFRVAAVYLSHEVPEDARCEDCGIEIRDLQDELRGLMS